jgi:hypothetical protein
MHHPKLKEVRTDLIKERKALDSVIAKLDSAMTELSGVRTADKAEKVLSLAKRQGVQKQVRQTLLVKEPTAAVRAKGERTWTEEQRREAGERMKRRWAEKHAQQAEA